MSTAIDNFINELLTAKKLNSLDDGVREQVRLDLLGRLSDQIDRAVIDAMSDSQIDIFTEMIDRGASRQELQAYIAQSGVDVERVTLETMLRFRALYIGE
ncbi:MAG: hypothetical protein Q4A34_03405 [Candidatus Saccharibacteria bacterium]|nr:hypothetical protein [Candidatus Saccharibacteria bacterium]